MGSRTLWLKEKLGPDLESLFGDKEEFGKNLAALNEVKLRFLFRHAGLFGNSAVKLLSSYVPPKVLAQLAKRLPRLSGELLHTVVRHMDYTYSHTFLKGFSEDELYRLAFGPRLDRVKFAPADGPYSQFLDRDLAGKVVGANLRQIQQFLRNVRQYGFRKHHRQWTGEAFAEKGLQDTVFKKVAQDETALCDLGFFLLNLSALNANAGEAYIERMIQLDLHQKIVEARLGDLALFILAIWTGGLFNPCDTLPTSILRQTVNTKAARSSASSLLEIAGIIEILGFDTVVPITFEDLSGRIGRCLAGLQSAAQEDNLEACIEPEAIQLWALRCALSILGVKNLVRTRSSPAIYQQLDRKLISHVLTEVREQISRDATTTMSAAFGRLPAAADRKCKLLQGAIDWLGPS